MYIAYRAIIISVCNQHLTGSRTWTNFPVWPNTLFWVNLSGRTEFPRKVCLLDTFSYDTSLQESGTSSQVILLLGKWHGIKYQTINKVCRYFVTLLWCSRLKEEQWRNKRSQCRLDKLLCLRNIWHSLTFISFTYVKI